ncbi:serine/threonine-protein phosphatase 2A 56 kDa regulatory subunit epsilon isoform isoform X2 [Drosophila santomea]|uniref:serine/threonine-protein phosphatase 2A 56 kDa regulatory subunit epsilon isoform isoform X2 n=1 Tax=Drosophila santomea TaxID=129105 RepID=UPI001952C458|nr:serine/threonine-protein phosphatase 2A 56 kDa regulatory subunit epsilon isoform isoform X2 [Drosophila santomea]
MSSSDSDSDSQPRCIDLSVCEIEKRTEMLAKKKVILELYSCFLNGWTFFPGDDERKLDKMIVVKLLEHLDTKDVDDRTYVQSLLRRVYIKLVYLREFILKQFSDVFYRFTFESIECHCIAELLEIYYDIIKGYSPPLSTDEEQVLFNVFLPLHKPQSMTGYFSVLIYCIIEFLHLKPSFIQRYVIGLLRLWPKTAYDKETLFLTEIASILVIQDEQEVTKALVPAFKQIAKCLSSQSAKLSRLYIYGTTTIFWSL